MPGAEDTWKQNGCAPVTLDEFEARDFGEQCTQLINGRVVIADRLPSDDEGILTATLAELIGSHLRRSRNAACRPAVRLGLRMRGSEIGRERDSYLIPALTVWCRSASGVRVPTTVVEVLSADEGLDNILDRIEAYKAVPTVADILTFSAPVMSASHYRRDNGVWLSARHVARPTDTVILDRLSIKITLSQINCDVQK